jgi:hypothetical protein
VPARGPLRIPVVTVAVYSGAYLGERRLLGKNLMEEAEGSARAETAGGPRRVSVLVPGWEMLKRDRRRDTLVAGLQLVDNGALLAAGEVPVGGFRAARLERASPRLFPAQAGTRHPHRSVPPA